MRVGVYTYHRDKAETIIRRAKEQFGGNLFLRDDIIYLAADNGDEWRWYKPHICTYRINKAYVDRELSDAELESWVYPLFIGRPDPCPIEFF